eukprot:541840_1
MISVFLKQTNAVDLKTPLYNHVTDCYSKADADSALEYITRFNDLRGRVVNLNQDRNVALDDLKQYLGMLDNVSKRFPFGQSNQASGGFFKRKRNDTIPVQFTWTDAFRATKPATTFNVKFERHCVMFNIGATYSLLAVKHDRSSLDGLKYANKAFMNAAGAFNELSECFGDIAGTEFTADMSQNSLNMLSQLMLAQAQACFFECATKKQMSKGIVAKLAAATSQLFQQAANNGNATVALQQWLKKGDYPFPEHCNFQAEAFSAAAQYWKSKTMLDEFKYGEEITRLQLCSVSLKNCLNHRHNGMVSALEQSRQTLLKMVDERLRRATKDNETIYHSKVPRGSELEIIESKVTVKPIPVELPNVAAADNPFASLVSANLREVSDTFAATLRSSLEDIQKSARTESETARAHLASLNLPAALDALEPDVGIPGDVWERVQDVQRKGGAPAVEETIQRVKTAAKECADLHGQVIQVLDEEAQIDKHNRIRHGTRWNLVPSEQITSKYRRDADLVLNYLKDARDSNDKVEREWRELAVSITDFAATREELAARIPKPPAQVGDGAAAERLRVNLDELSQLLDEREKLVQSLRDASTTDFVTMVASAPGQSPDQILAAYRSATVSPLENSLSANIGRQGEITQMVTNHNREFMASRENSAQLREREALLHKLNQTAEKYNVVTGHLNEGLTFYSDLRVDYVTPLKQTVSDFAFARKSESESKIQQLGGIGQQPAMGSGQPQPAMGAGQPAVMRAGQPQPMGAGQPQPMGAGQPQPMGAGQPQPMGASQPQPMGASQPQQMRASQPAMGAQQPAMGAGQPQPMGAQQPGLNNMGDMRQALPDQGRVNAPPMQRQLSSGKWTCTFCTFDNSDSNASCEMCSKSKAAGGPQYSQPAPASAPAAYAQQYQQPPAAQQPQSHVYQQPQQPVYQHPAAAQQPQYAQQPQFGQPPQAYGQPQYGHPQQGQQPMQPGYQHPPQNQQQPPQNQQQPQYPYGQQPPPQQYPYGQQPPSNYR